MAAIYNSPLSGVIIKTGRTGKADLSKVLLKNKITSKIKPFQEFAIETERKGSEAGDRTAEYPEGLDECDVKTYKLYDIDGSGKPILYFYAEPVTQQILPLSSSGFYSINNGKLHNLVTGYECGGTLGGNCVRFWYDGETRRVMLGTQEKWGGFGGHSYGGTVYDYKNGEAAKVFSFDSVDQKAGNYDKKDLLKYADLFYDDDEKPYNKDNISKAEWVTEYTVNEIRTTVEQYKKAVELYQQIEVR